jgi:hypothetical protein
VSFSVTTDAPTQSSISSQRLNSPPHIKDAAPPSQIVLPCLLAAVAELVLSPTGPTPTHDLSCAFLQTKLLSPDTSPRRS